MTNNFACFSSPRLLKTRKISGLHYRQIVLQDCVVSTTLWNIVGYSVVFLSLLPSVLQTVHPHPAVKPLFIQPVLALYLPVAPRCCHSDPMVFDPIFFKITFKSCLMGCLLHEQRVCPLCSVVGLYFSYRKRKIFDSLLEKIQRTVCTVFVIHFSETVSCTFVNRRVLIVFLPVCHAIARYKFYSICTFCPGYSAFWYALGLQPFLFSGASSNFNLFIALSSLL